MGWCCGRQLLDRGPHSTQAAVLQILHCVIHCIDIPSTSSVHVINADLLRVVTRYIEVLRVVSKSCVCSTALEIISLSVSLSQ